MKQLQEKYKEDRQLLNQKMMEFYRENHVSPFGSCLPLLLQMPVFLGLFYMLREAGQAAWWEVAANPADVIGQFAAVWHSAPVGWLWIKDITNFDIILMFLYIASQFLSSWQMARKGAGQQKVIAYIMPLMIGIFMFIYKWPAGLFIYWFTSNLWTIAQQFVLEEGGAGSCSGYACFRQAEDNPGACAREDPSEDYGQAPGETRRQGDSDRPDRQEAGRERNGRKDPGSGGWEELEARPVAKRRDNKGNQRGGTGQRPDRGDWRYKGLWRSWTSPPANSTTSSMR